MSLDQQTLQKHELEAVLDELALQVMVSGTAALDPKALGKLIRLGTPLSLSELVAKAEMTSARLTEKALTDDEARAVIAQMQDLLKASSASQNTTEVLDSDSDQNALDEDAELLGDFVLEADEHLTFIEEGALLLERDPSQLETVHAVFRSFHSIKGLAGFLGLRGVQAVAHEVETLLDHARNSRLSVSSAFVDLILESSEYLKDEVAAVRARVAGVTLPEVRDSTRLLATLSAATANVAAGLSAFPNESAIADKAPPAEELQAVAAPGKSEPAGIKETVTPEALQAPTPVVTSAPLTAVSPQPEGNAKRPTQEISIAGSSSERTQRQEPASGSIRIETSKLDRLMDMVGELVIAQSILNNKFQAGSAGLGRAASELVQMARITTEVQRCAMSMRMMPIGPLFQKNAKMVRDLARRSGKQVSLEISGESTELDKTIAEELADPLVHMIRNALDHGIETPEERATTGKPATASLRIAAEHQSGQILISISDDGRGLDPERIRGKAIQRGLIDETAQLSEEEVFRLIFAPGFSTAERITDISGRGVGMDVVRQHVESLRGHIGIESQLGKGTTFLIHLPLTLAIIEGLVILVGEHRYIVPLFSVREMLKPTRDMLFTVQGKEEMIMVRGSLLPLIRLHRRFEIAPRSEDVCQGLLVICEFANKVFCLFVDDLLGRQEVVIKSLDEAFKDVKGLAGSAILGDGRIGLILDVAGIFYSQSSNQQVRAA